MSNIMSRVHLIIACYGGPRRTPDQDYEMDRSHYLRLQEESLAKLDHNLAQITFISTGGEPSYIEYLNTLRSRYNVIDRSNIGMSYGSFDAGWQADRSYDYYIFLEDDYILIKDNFDTLMVEMFESMSDCGYLCQLAWGMRAPHPAVFNGMASRECLTRLDILPGAQAMGKDLLGYYGSAESTGQKAWGDRVAGVGLKVYDMGKRFRAPFVEADGSYICWHPEAPDYLMVPAQLYRNIWSNRDFAIENSSISDEEWRNFQTYYLFFRSVYLTPEDRARFTANVSPCRLKTREDMARAASLYDGISKHRADLMRKELNSLNQYAEQFGGEK